MLFDGAGCRRNRSLAGGEVSDGECMSELVAQGDASLHQRTSSSCFVPRQEWLVGPRRYGPCISTQHPGSTCSALAIFTDYGRTVYGSGLFFRLPCSLCARKSARQKDRLCNYCVWTNALRTKFRIE